MIPRENFAIKLCGKLQKQEPLVSAREWRLVGQEQDCTQIFTWISQSANGKNLTKIGAYSQETHNLKVLHTFHKQLNIIQASINDSHTLLGYIIKDTSPSTFEVMCDQNKFVYKPYILQLKCKSSVEPCLVENERNRQVMIQFMYKKNRGFIGRHIHDKFLLLVHLECIKSYSTILERDGVDDYTEDTWSMDENLSAADGIVKAFSWAQWDPVHQVLYYIHYRLPIQSSIEGEEVPGQNDITPTLSGLQFHPDMPHETVLNIPLNLPQLPSSTLCGLYEDDAVPLRIHDCSLDLQIVSSPKGIVCICHHYLYKSVEGGQDDAKMSININQDVDLSTQPNINFAYSVTLLHHGYVTHCVIPDLMWPLAKALRPTYFLYNDDYLLVHLPMLFTHLLDVGLLHEPCCHIVLPPNTCVQGDKLVSLLTPSSSTMVDMATLDIARVNISSSHMVAAFKSDTAVGNKLAILHYFLQHELNMDIVEELICHICNSPNEPIGAQCQVLKEFLIGGAYTATKSCLPSSAANLTRLLPLTTNSSNKPTSVTVGGIRVGVSQEQLWNTTMMLLSPRQRIVPFRCDMWTSLWDYLAPLTLRFKPHQVLDKLRVSLACYQPEALSRCSTPLSPCGAPPRRLPSSGPSALLSSQAQELPFLEMDTCTASKQEHVISVNLREVSMHLLKHGQACCAGSVGGAGGAPLVHAAATRYAGAQLETSRALALSVCKASQATASQDQETGFSFIDNMTPAHRHILLKSLERYTLAADSLAFPLPQGLSSFLTYLGYRTLSFDNFMQYVHRNVFEIQIDFLKTIIAEAGNDTKLVLRAIRLAALGGRGRGRRALLACPHPAAVLLRAREHAVTLLEGHPTQPTRPHTHAHLNTHTNKGLAAFPSNDRLSPLDTFLDLLTAKASLNELDFNLLIDATMLAETGNN